MDALEADMNELEAAMRLFFQTMKRPQRWASITAQARVSLDRPAAAILHTLLQARPEGWRVQDIAAHLGIEAPSVTRKTQELEQAGYIQRSRNPKDRRAIGLQITPKGRSVSKRLWKAQCQMIGQAFDSWPPAQRKQFISLFERFASDLAQQSPIVKLTDK